MIYILALAFQMIGVTLGFLVMLIFCVAIHQDKFSWMGALAAVSMLAGDSFLSYAATTLNFEAYTIGFSIGVTFYV